ncbi:hypothetical protein NST74_27920 [Paenibacillus sp. FSL F4-0125]|uniref:hypothetical protein n=1 Tax=Paenibacillus sp. FSL F4-0125 TaxID=2954730 RepID=UPI0030F65C6B
MSDQIQEVYSSIFSFYLNDGIMSQFRKMMTIEQYRNPDMSQLFMALHFYSPIFLLLFRYDGQIEKADEALELVKSHIKISFQINSRVREEE